MYLVQKGNSADQASNVKLFLNIDLGLFSPIINLNRFDPMINTNEKGRAEALRSLFLCDLVAQWHTGKEQWGF